ncbi:hypothetical protein FXE34_12045 [Vibrio cholerae]|uniref:Uncharacterized protein n=1 Tax=Vibrio cholerae TaxID=666 RepID=A0A5C9STW2_VIBCL|nr:hypothetical protein [Vibrio cholerae]ORP14697.1 hypothetical protein B7947_04210 [Vibrio paracholerae]EGR5061416.1 hypothetical protein [Vibrio cholerae]ORP26577.1 hypothetical protein B7953_01940 [Vibrio paracholerae]RBM63920.1 hypothetical protein DLR67_00815 [Vibrio paracholerae]
MVMVFDHKHASLFKKNPNGWFQRIYSKKLLTLLTHIRIMRSVLSDKALSFRKENKFWLRSSVG